MKESELNQETVQTTSTPTPSETTELQSAPLSDGESGISTPSTVSEPVDTGSARDSYGSKNENNDDSRTEGVGNRTDNDVDEGVDLQGNGTHCPDYQNSFGCSLSCDTISCLCYYHYNSLLLVFVGLQLMIS